MATQSNNHHFQQSNENMNGHHRMHLSTGDLSLCTSKADDAFIKVQNNQLATRGGKSAVLLFFKTSSKKSRKPLEPKILMNNYVSDGGIKQKKERFKDSRDFVKKSDKLQTMSCFPSHIAELNELTIKVTEGNEDMRNHAYTCTDRTLKKGRRGDYCSLVHNNNLVTKRLNYPLKRQKEYAVPQLNKNKRRKRDIVVTEGNDNVVRPRIEPRLQSEDNINNDEDPMERKKKVIEEMILRDEKTVFIALQENLIKENSKNPLSLIERKINKLKENDISINSIIDQLEDKDNNNSNNKESADNHPLNKNENGEEGEMNKSYKASHSHPSKTSQKGYLINHYNLKLKSTSTKPYSQSQREIELKKIKMKPRVDVNEYLTEITKCMSHHKSYSTLSNNHQRLLSYQDTNKAVTLPNQTDKHGSLLKNSTLRHPKSKSNHSKKSTTSCNGQVNHCQLEEDKCDEAFYKKKPLMINPDEFDQLLMVKVEQERQKTSGTMKQKRERYIAKYIELLRLQDEINTKREHSRPKLIQNEYYIGKRSLESKRSLSQSTIIEPNDYYSHIIQTQGLLGVEPKDKGNSSLTSISKGEYDEFIKEKEEQIKKGKIGSLEEDRIKKGKIVKFLKKLGLSDKGKEKEDKRELSRTSSQKLFEKVQKTITQTDKLLLNDIVNQLLREGVKEAKLENPIEENEKGQEKEVSIEKERLLTLPNITKDSKEGRKDTISNNSNDQRCNYVIETPKKRSPSNTIKEFSKGKAQQPQIDQNNKEDTIKPQDEEQHQPSYPNNIEIIEEPLISENIKLTNKSNDNYLLESPLKESEPLQTLTSKEEAEEEEEHLESKANFFKELFTNFSEWYIFFIKRNIMINIVKYANDRSSYQSGFEMIVEVVKREPFYQINSYYKYQLYLLIIRGCFIHYIREAFTRIVFFRNRTKAFVNKITLLFRFISLERIQFYGAIKEHLQLKQEEEAYKHYIQANNAVKASKKSDLSNEVIPEVNNSNLMENTFYYQEEYLSFFAEAMNNVFILPATYRGLQAIYDYAFNNEIDDQEVNINRKSRTNSLTGDIFNRKLDMNNQLNQLEENNSRHSLQPNAYLYDSFEKISSKQIHPNSEDSDCLHRAYELLKYERDQLSNQTDLSFNSFRNDRSQKSLRNIDISMINSSQLSQHAYSQKSNKKVLSIDDLSKKKPGIRLKIRLDDMKTPTKKNNTSKGLSPSSNQGSSNNLNENAVRKRSADRKNTVSDQDISADKDMGSGIDWDYIISNNRGNSLNSPVKKEEISKGNEKAVGSIEENKESTVKIGFDRPDEERFEEKNYLKEFSNINVDNIENSANEISLDIFNDKKEQIIKESEESSKPIQRENKEFESKGTTDNIIEVNDNCNIIITSKPHYEILRSKDITGENSIELSKKFAGTQTLNHLERITPEMIDQLSMLLANEILESEVLSKEKPLLPQKQPLATFFDGLGLSIPGNFFSVFLRSVGELSKESALNFYNNRIAPLIIHLITKEIETSYNQIISKISIPIVTNPYVLMNSYLLQSKHMRENSRSVISKDNKVFLSKSILTSFNEATAALSKEHSSSIDIADYQMLNECLVDAANELIEKERKYGQIGVPLPWSIRSRDVICKYDLSPKSMNKLQRRVEHELTRLLSIKMGLITSNHEDLDQELLAQDRERKFIGSISKELIGEDAEWKALEGEETEVKLTLSKGIIDQLLNEIVEIMEHVHFSRKEPLKYQHKSIYACEDIPRLSFQNTTENDNLNSNDGDNIHSND